MKIELNVLQLHLLTIVLTEHVKDISRSNVIAPPIKKQIVENLKQIQNQLHTLSLTVQ